MGKRLRKKLCHISPYAGITQIRFTVRGRYLYLSPYHEHPLIILYLILYTFFYLIARDFLNFFALVKTRSGSELQILIRDDASLFLRSDQPSS